MKSRAMPVLVLALVAGLAAATAGREAAPAAPPRAAPWAMAATPDGGTLFVACGGRGEVAQLDVDAGRVVRVFPVGGTPRGLALAPDGATLAVSVDPDDDVVLLDPDSGRERARIPVGMGPERLVFSADGARLFVALRIDMQLAEVDVATRRVLRRLPAGREPFAVARSPDGETVAVVSRRAALAPPDAAPYSEVALVDARAGAVRRVVRLPSVHLAEAAAFTPDGRRLLVPGLRVRNLLPIVQVARGWVVSGVLASIDPVTGRAAVLPLSTPEEGFADPAGVAISADGRTALLTSGGGNHVAQIDLDALFAAEDAAPEGADEDLALAENWIAGRTPTGPNPRGVLRLGAGTAAPFAVSLRLDDAVLILDPRGEVLRRIPLGPETPPDALLRGERAFHDAQYCFQEAFSCRSCHPEAHSDGLTYDFEIDGVGEHVLLNRSLRGLEGTAPYKWTGLNPSLQRQCGARFAMVLTRARVIPDARLDDMAAWLLSLPPPRPPIDVRRASPEVQAAVERGAAIFARSRDDAGRRLRPTERCITCHPPPRFTNRQITDVGTRGARDATGRFDVPHLLGIGRGGPFLHDGRALTLEDIWRAADEEDRHGKVSDLTDAQFADLIAYLRHL